MFSFTKSEADLGKKVGSKNLIKYLNENCCKMTNNFI